MEKKSKILIAGMITLIGLSIIATFYRTLIVKDYPIIEEDISTTENNS